MKHARSDYDRIQDPAGIIPSGEPVFLLRGQDVLASAVVDYWADLAEDNDLDPAVVQCVREHGEEMARWKGSRLPTVPREALRHTYPGMGVTQPPVKADTVNASEVRSVHGQEMTAVVYDEVRSVEWSDDITTAEVRHANLGHATTAQLLDELKARVEVDIATGYLGNLAGPSIAERLSDVRRRLDRSGRLDYRTVDGD